MRRCGGYPSRPATTWMSSLPRLSATRIALRPAWRRTTNSATHPARRLDAARPGRPLRPRARRPRPPHLGRRHPRPLRPRDGHTPLHAAVAGNPAALVTLPLAQGPDADFRKSIGWSSLHLAADTSAEDAVALLLAHGADPHEANGPDRTPLAMALRRGHDTVAALIREADPSQASVRPDCGPSGAASLVAPASLLRFPTTRP